MSGPDVIHYIVWTWEALCILVPAFFLAVLTWRVSR